MKKITRSVLAMSLAAAMLTGCGGAAGSDGAVQSEESGGSSAIPIEAESVKLMDMQAVDLDQQEVRPGDIISGNKVTMVNYWGTFCGPCIGEMPYLQELSEEYKDQGFGVLGVTCDVVQPDGSYSEEAISDGKDILKDTGVTYPVIVATNEINDLFNADAVPVTYFLDSEGKLLGEAYVGSREKDDWNEIITEKLAEIE